MANTWPATLGTTTGTSVPGANNVTTVRWGTDGVLQTKPASGFYVVLRASQRQLAENIKLPNGTGPTATRILLTFGSQWNLTVRDDTQMTAPAVGTTVVVTDMAGIVPATVGGAAVGNVFTATVVDSGYDVSPKQAGERTLTIESLVLIDSQVKGVAV